PSARTNESISPWAELLSDDLVDRKQRRHHRYDEPADNNTDYDDREGPDDPDGAIQASAQLRLIEFGDSPCQHRQLTGILPQAQSANRHRRQRPGRRQRLRKLAALAHPVDNI